MASKRAKRRKQCDGKRQYKNAQEALAHARSLNIGRYQCNYCNQWHVGHVPKKVKISKSAKHIANMPVVTMADWEKEQDERRNLSVHRKSDQES